MYKKQHKKNKGNLLILITIILYISSLFLISIVYSFSNTNLEIDATSSILLNNNNLDYEIIENGKWTENNLFYYNFGFNIKYTGNEIAKGYKVIIKTPNDMVVKGCYNAICNIENNTLVVTNPDYFYQISTNQTITFSLQLQTSENYYYPTIIDIIFITDDDEFEDLLNTPFPGYIEDDLTSHKNTLVWNFNNQSTDGWFIEGSNELIKFNNGYALGIKNIPGEKVVLKNHNIDSIKAFNKYKVLSYRLYVPAISNISLIKYYSFVYNRNVWNWISGKYSNDNFNGDSLGDLRLTSDGRYFVLERTMEKIENISENCFADMIEIIGNYSGYVLIDSIVLSTKGQVEEEDNSKYAAKLVTENYWTNTTQFSLQLFNNSNENIDNWYVEITLPNETHISSFWSGKYILKDNILVITPESWNSTIAPGGSVSIGMQLTNDNSTLPLNAFINKAIATSSNLKEIDLLK